jgi:UDP-MurNAc hydroxylase
MSDAVSRADASPGPLHFTFIGNACGIFRGSQGTRILCDPWVVDGAFDGSWCHYPKLETKLSDLQDVDAIYVSHLHPDHFDERHFDFDKGLPLIVLDHPPNFLIKKLTAIGFTNLIRIRDKETVRFREFELTMHAPFAKHTFHEAAIGNLIDSALHLACEGVSALNANDNVLTVGAARMLRECHGEITLAMLNYNPASPYPGCFNNLTDDEKLSENRRVLLRNFVHVQAVVKELKPRFMLPFAGTYVLGGDLHPKNRFLGTATWDECADWLTKQGIAPTRTVVLRENDTLDVVRGVADRPYVPVDVAGMKRYIESELACMRYPYQLEAMPDAEPLFADIERASGKLVERMEKLGARPTFHVVVHAFSRAFQIYPVFKPLSTLDGIERLLACWLDERLLRMVLDRRSHWNNAEGGSHVTYHRSPNLYEPDLHIGLQFFHL